MRIGELSARTGVPVPTIKYYVREGLLSGGERISHNQVSYDEEHVRRLRLVRAMVETGSLPIVKVREVLAEVDDPKHDLDRRLGVVSRALSQTRQPLGEPDPELLREALAVAERRGWAAISPMNFHVRALAEVLERLRMLGMESVIERIDDYARAAQSVAETDIELLAGVPEPDEMLETMIVGTVLGDALFAALRRIAQVEFSWRQFGGDPEGPEVKRPENKEN
jgi:DNA-binding transcriptional MerR regulator